MGQGAHRMSAPGLKEDVELALKELRGEHLGRQVNLKIIFWIILMRKLQNRWKKSVWEKKSVNF